MKTLKFRVLTVNPSQVDEKSRLFIGSITNNANGILYYLESIGIKLTKNKLYVQSKKGRAFYQVDPEYTSNLAIDYLYEKLSFITDWKNQGNPFSIVIERIKVNGTDEVKNKMPVYTIDDLVDNIQKFAIFTANFPLDFIEQVWKDEPLLARHFREKIRGQARLTDGYISYNAFMRWFMELTPNNAKKLITWMMDNYTR